MKSLVNSLHPYGYKSVWKEWLDLIHGPVGSAGLGQVGNVWDSFQDAVDAAVDSIHDNVYDDLDGLRWNEDHR